MYKTGLILLMATIMFLSCDGSIPPNIPGTYYSEDGMRLELNPYQTFFLDNTSNASTTFDGNYKIRNGKLIINIKNSIYKRYRIISQTQSKNDRYEFFINGRDFGPLVGANCIIERDGKVTEESITDERGFVEFNYFPTGKLKCVPGFFGWEAAEIDLIEFTGNSAVIEIEREKFIENTSQFKFTITDNQLVGEDEISHWRLEKVR